MFGSLTNIYLLDSMKTIIRNAISDNAYTNNPNLQRSDLPFQ